jgi:hypothetical protein
LYCWTRREIESSPQRTIIIQAAGAVKRSMQDGTGRRQDDGGLDAPAADQNA